MVGPQEALPTHLVLKVVAVALIACLDVMAAPSHACAQFAEC